MIERAIEAAVAPILEELGVQRELTTSHRHWPLSQLGLMHLKSTDITMLWGGVDVPEGPSSELPAVYEITLTSLIGDIAIVDGDEESDAREMDEEEQ
uniref:Uncharacterized protein n=1 Tax=Solanum tuberosum TaxID=4113 RepID=M1DYT3_SOLTU